jgi:hypothetical protein
MVNLICDKFGKWGNVSSETLSIFPPVYKGSYAYRI